MCLLLLLLVTSLGLPQAQPQPKIHLDIGSVYGIQKLRTWEFLGIQFATAEKWKAPHNLKDTPFPTGSFNATTLGPCCTQLSGSGNPVHIPPNVGMSDAMTCLHMNIFTPTNVNPSDKLPVMVWIFGGGAMFGCNNQDVPLIYNGTNLINHAPPENKVIVVTINYRLNAYGKLYLDYLAQEDKVAAGNYNALDQLAALQWLNKHVAQFGGNPDSVTVFGESAGGDFAAAITVAKGSTGLVHRFISESTVTGNVAGWTLPDEGNQQGLQLVEKVNCTRKTGAAMMQCLQELPDDVLPAVMGMVQLTAVVNGELFSAPPGDILTLNPPPGIDAIIGFNLPDNFPGCSSISKKYPLPSPMPEELRQFVINTLNTTLPLWGFPGQELLTGVLDAYGIYTCKTVHRCCLAYEHLMDDAVFGCNARRVLMGMAKAGRNAHLYKFGCHAACAVGNTSAEKVPCVHTSEIAYVFGTQSAYAHDGDQCTFTNKMRDFSNAVIKRWTEFAYTGKVSGWQPVQCGTEQYLNISLFNTDYTSFPMAPLVGQSTCNIWDKSQHDSFVKKYKHLTPPPATACPCTPVNQKKAVSCASDMSVLNVTTLEIGVEEPLDMAERMVKCAARLSCQTQQMTQECHNWDTLTLWGC